MKERSLKQKWITEEQGLFNLILKTKGYEIEGDES